MTDSNNVNKPSAALVDFVLRNAQVKTNVCSFQESQNDGYRLSQRTLPDYNFIYAMRDGLVWVVDNQPLDLSAGSLVTVRPAVGHHAYSHTKQTKFGSIHVEVTLPGGQDVFELLLPPLVQQVDPGSRLAAYFTQAMEEFKRPRTADANLMLKSWGRLVALELIRHDAQAGLLVARPVDPVVADVLDELRSRINQPTTLEELAQWAGFSSQHLNRLFSRLLGVTPLQYLTRMRMERACELLLEGRYTVKAIARHVGMSDPYYFSRVFKQYFGRSPSQYRREAGSEFPLAHSLDPLL